MHIYGVTDLRMKMEPSTQEEPLSSTASSGIGNNSSANGSLGSISSYESERDKADLMPSTLWNTGKLAHKSGSVNTPDGKQKKKLNERLVIGVIVKSMYSVQGKNALVTTIT